jgi:hypothetical protein
MLLINVDASAIERLGNLIGAAGAKAKPAIVRALKRAGDSATIQVRRALVPQTGLKRKVLDRAVKGSMTGGVALYEIRSRGGDIRLKYFTPRETRRGVSAKPFNRRRVTPGAFMRAGWWPNRVDKRSWNGQVFRRTGATSRSGMDQFEVVRSGVVIPAEMVQGQSQAAFFRAVDDVLPRRLEHELFRVLGIR